MFEVNTVNASCVMPKMAGTLSTANNTSVLSTTSSTRNSGVMQRTAGFDDEELFAVVLAGHGKQLPRTAHQQVLLGVRLRVAVHGQLDGRVDQKRAEDRHHPVEPLAAAPRRPG